MHRFIRYHIDNGIYLIADHYDHGLVQFRLKYKTSYSAPYRSETEALAAVPEFRRAYLM